MINIQITKMLNFPKNWIPSFSPRATYCFDVEENGRNNHVLITTHQIKRQDRLINMQFAYHAMSQQVKEEKYHMVEENVKVQIMQTPTGLGYYFMATDSEWVPSSSDWPYLVRCMFVGQQTAIELTVLCFNHESIVIQQAFDLLNNPCI